jgi:hypothetical protein
MKFFPLSTLLVLFLFSCSPDTQPTLGVYYTLSVDAGVGGQVSQTGGTFEKGTVQVIQAIADPGYIFDRWEGWSGDQTASLQINLDQPLNLKAIFRYNTQSIGTQVPLIIQDFVDPGYVLAIVNGAKTAYLLDHQGNKKHTWTFEKALGQDIELMDDGTIMGAFKAPNPSVAYGGQNGLIQHIGLDGSVLWNYSIMGPDFIGHHDIEIMPNGHVLALVWSRMSREVAQSMGLEIDTDVFPEKVIEIDPVTSEIVWSWDSRDHLVQGLRPGGPNYGDPNASRHKINFTYQNEVDIHEFVGQGDIMHINGLDYHPQQDIIALSVNFYGEVWIIDHSTTTAEAKTGSGGQFGRGGDLILRWGNPNVYGTYGQPQQLHYNHHPSFIEKEGKTLLSLFHNNKEANGYSEAYVFDLSFFRPGVAVDTQVPVHFSFSDPSMFFPRVGGVQTMSNGNLLITEGDYGFWEVNPQGLVVWKYDGLGVSFWRGMYVPTNHPALSKLSAN